MDECTIIILVMQEFDRAGIIAATRAAVSLLEIDTASAFVWACQINHFETALQAV